MLKVKEFCKGLPARLSRCPVVGEAYISAFENLPLASAIFNGTLKEALPN